MLYPYAEFAGHLIVTCSDIKKDEKGNEFIYVNFEQPTDHSFKEARYKLPGYKKINKEKYLGKSAIENEDFLDKEIEKQIDIIKHNEELIWKVSRNKGKL